MERIIGTPYADAPDMTSVLPIANGGTGATTPTQAVSNLGGISVQTLGENSGVAQLDASSKMKVDQLPAAIITTPTLDIPTIYAGMTATIEITNYDALTAYTVAFSSGTHWVDDSLIYYTPSINDTSVTMTINNRTLTLPIEAPSAKAPSISYPINGSTGVSSSPLLAATNYEVTAGQASFLSADWQVALDSEFKKIKQFAYGVTADYSPLTLQCKGLALNTTYWIRTRHTDKIYGSGPWSTPVKFTTRSSDLLVSEKANFSPATKTTSGRFGYDVKVSADGTWVFCTEPYATIDTRANAGRLHVFKKSATTGIFNLYVSTAGYSDAGGYYSQGFATTSDAVEFAVGAPGLTQTYAGEGLVLQYIRSVSNGGIGRYQEIKHPSPCANGGFGRVIAISPDNRLMAISSARAGTDTTDIGHVYLYRRNGSSWTYLEEALPNTTMVASSLWGTGVYFLNEEVLAIASPGETVSSVANAGAVRLYSVSEKDVTYIHTVTAPTATAEKFGSFVASDSTVSNVLISATGYSTNTGRVYHYTKVTTGSNHVSYSGTITSSTPVTNDFFGSSIAVSDTGDTAWIGNSANSVGNTLSGSVHVFSRSGATWTYQSKLTSVRNEAGMAFGASLALSKDQSCLIVGSPGCDYGLTDAGMAHLFS